MRNKCSAGACQNGSHTASLRLHSISISPLSPQRPLREALVIALATLSPENVFEATHSFVQAEINIYIYMLTVFYFGGQAL